MWIRSKLSSDSVCYCYNLQCLLYLTEHITLFIYFLKKLGYEGNFTINKDPNSQKWQLVITHPLDTKTLQENTELLITMSVEESGKSSKGTSVLILKLPSHDTTEETLKFKKEFYIAIYPKAGKGSIDFDSAIDFANSDKTKDAKIIVKGKL